MVPDTAADVRRHGRAGDVAEDDLANVEISLRNNTTREQLAADGSWGIDVVQGWHRISPANIGGASYNWSWTTPFGLTPGSYSFSVRATDDLGLTTIMVTHDMTEALLLADRIVVLIDGRTLARLMYDYGIGLRLARTLPVKQVDDAYFEGDVG